MRRLVLICAVASLCLSLVPAALAQVPASPELRNAQTLFQAQKWPEAVVALEAILKADTQKIDPRPRAILAAALFSMGEYKRALPLAMEANRLLSSPDAQANYPGLLPGGVMVRIARIHNRLGNTDEAFKWLDQAANYFLPNVTATLQTDTDLANLRSDPRWKKFEFTVKSNIDPCGMKPEYRQFDFWVGDWEVLSTSGQKVGDSLVERTLNNCVIFETYKAAPGTSAVPSYVGQAFHFFEQNSQKWVQHYIDTVASPFDWTGEFKEGAMRYAREGPFGPSNSQVMQKMTFTPRADGKVHQLFEQSFDGAKTWRSGFDGLYVKRVAAAASSNAPAPAPLPGGGATASKPEVPSEEREMEMALSAGPEHLRQEAGVYVLTATGYRLARPAKNNFTCIVNRDHPQALKPTCFDEEGTATIIPKLLRVGELMMQGKPMPEINAEIRAGFASGKFISPRRPGIAYMLSGDIRNVNPANGQISSFPAHVMFYAPNLTNSDIGANGSPGLPFVAYQGPHGYMILPVGSPTAHRAGGSH